MINQIKEKLCCKCKIIKPISYFYKDKQKKDGYSSSCKDCKYSKKDISEIEQDKLKKKIDLENEFIERQFEYWKVIKVSNKSHDNHIYYTCECICGKIRDVRKTQLKNKKSTSCGCNGNLNIKGLRFEKLLVITNAYRKEDNRIYVKVKCDCGKEKEVLKQSLESGLTKSCGCLNKEILKSRTGLMHPNFKPELSDEEREANNSRGNNSRYQKFRRIVLKRDKNTCQCCGSINNTNMRVHHLESWNNNEKLRFDPENAITLCPKCHDIQYKGSFHNIYGNGNNTREQYEEYIEGISWNCKGIYKSFNLVF